MIIIIHLKIGKLLIINYTEFVNNSALVGLLDKSPKILLTIELISFTDV